MGCLVSSAFLTLVALPTIDATVEGFAGWLRRLWRASAPERRSGAPVASDGAAADTA